jgi:hypothetical protein
MAAEHGAQQIVTTCIARFGYGILGANLGSQIPENDDQIKQKGISHARSDDQQHQDKGWVIRVEWSANRTDRNGDEEVCSGDRNHCLKRSSSFGSRARVAPHGKLQTGNDLPCCD